MKPVEIAETTTNDATKPTTTEQAEVNEPITAGGSAGVDFAAAEEIKQDPID